MDPLAQLNDIHLPANVHSYPIAPGWWILATLMLALIVYALVKLRQYLVKRKSQKIALKQLTALTQASDIVALLKWAALKYFPREQVAHITGEGFKTFLIATLPAKYQATFTDLSAANFTSVYESDGVNTNVEDFSAAAQLWLKHALPPQQTSKVNNDSTEMSTESSKNDNNDGVVS